MSRKKSSVGCLFWIALILLVLIVLLVKYPQISKAMDTTGILKMTNSEKKDKQKVPKMHHTDTENETKEINKIPDEPEITENTTKDEPVRTPDPEETVTNNTPENMRNARLYFIREDSSGNFNLSYSKRPIFYDDSPLTKTLNSLIGPLSTGELNSGLRTLIPSKAKLLSIKVKNGTAILNFNESFRYNTFGVEGLKFQLQQIVYTATEFPTVNNVQILIENKRIDFLEAEGINISKPLNRNSFNY